MLQVIKSFVSVTSAVHTCQCRTRTGVLLITLEEGTNYGTIVYVSFVYGFECRCISVTTNFGNYLSSSKRIVKLGSRLLLLLPLRQMELLHLHLLLHLALREMLATTVARKMIIMTGTAIGTETGGVMTEIGTRQDTSKYLSYSASRFVQLKLFTGNVEGTETETVKGLDLLKGGVTDGQTILLLCNFDSDMLFVIRCPVYPVKHSVQVLERSRARFVWVLSIFYFLFKKIHAPYCTWGGSTTEYNDCII